MIQEIFIGLMILVTFWIGYAVGRDKEKEKNQIQLNKQGGKTK